MPGWFMDEGTDLTAGGAGSFMEEGFGRGFERGCAVGAVHPDKVPGMIRMARCAGDDPAFAGVREGGRHRVPPFFGRAWGIGGAPG